MRRATLLVSLLLFADVASGIASTLTCHLIAPGHNAQGVVLVLTPLRVAAAGEIRRPVASTATTFAVAVPDGQWMVDVESESFWHERQYLTIGGDRQLDVRLRPAGVADGVREIRVPMMEPGDYTLCSGPAGGAPETAGPCPGALRAPLWSV